MNRGSVVVLGIFALGAVANAQLGVSVGTYNPKSSNVKSVFGSNSFAWGPNFGNVGRDSRKGLGADFTGLSLSAPGNRLFTLGSTYGYEVQSGDSATTLTYARIGTGIAYYDYSFTGVALGTSSGRQFKGMSVAEAGVVLNKQFTISAQYIMMSKVGGNDFSGLRLQAVFSLSR